MHLRRACAAPLMLGAVTSTLLHPGVEGAASDGSSEPEGGADRHGACGQPEVGEMGAAYYARLRRARDGRSRRRAGVLVVRDRCFTCPLLITTDWPLAVRYALTLGGAGCAPENGEAAWTLADESAAALDEALDGADWRGARGQPEVGEMGAAYYARLRRAREGRPRRRAGVLGVRDEWFTCPLPQTGRWPYAMHSPLAGPAARQRRPRRPGPWRIRVPRPWTRVSWRGPAWRMRAA